MFFPARCAGLLNFALSGLWQRIPAYAELTFMLLYARSMKNIVTQHYKVPLNTDLARSVEQLAAETQCPPDAVIAQIVDEGLRVRRHPGIEFRDTAFGRRPYVVGSRLGVWDVVLIWKANQENRTATLQYLDPFAERQLDAALGYSQEFPGELEEYIRESRMTREKILSCFLRWLDGWTDFDLCSMMSL
jgi:hypothetical protein